MKDERARARLPKDFTPFEPHDVEGTIVDRFARIVSRYAESIAIDDGSSVLSYRELDRATNRLARELVGDLGAASEPVALLYRHGVPFHVAQFGVIKAGKFYASLDSELAPPRLALLLENLGARLLLCDSASEPLAREVVRDLPGTRVQNTEKLDATASAEPPVVDLTADSLAYVIYTSGSTGPPEGVVATHRYVLHAALAQINGSHLAPRDRGSQICPLSSAASTNEAFPMLLNGGGVFPFAVKQEGVTNVRGLVRWLEDKRITVFVSVPVLFRLLAASLGKRGRLPDVRLVRLSGDRILSSDVDLYKRHFSADCLLRAAYGASECSIATEFFIDHEYETSRPIVPAGYPVGDTEVSVVDENLNPLPPGQQGEIAVRTRYTAVGYWQNPKRTAERFLADPHADGMKTYLTRDLGCFEDDGCLIHLGRTDFRVKVYGKWVAVTDIEEALLGVPGVREAVVVARADGPHGNVLIAYYTTAAGSKLAPESMRAALSGYPVEVVPKDFIALDEMPVTRSNKIDRKKLAEQTSGG